MTGAGIETEKPRWYPTDVGRTLLAAAAWLVVGALSVVALGRLVYLDDVLSWPYAALNALTPLLYLPVYASLVVGFGLRRNALMLATVPLIGLHLFWTVPEIWPGGAEKAPDGAQPVRVLSANLLYHNASAGRLGSQIEAAHPDIVVLVEASPLTLGAVQKSGALAHYPYRVDKPAAGAFGYAVYSRYPLSDLSAPVVGGQPLARMTVALDGGRRFVLYPVHTIAPTSAENTREWRAQLSQLATEVHGSRLPVVLAGDFNATHDHRPFRRLLSSGVRDTHDATGTSWSPTWPANGLLPPVLRIDHVLASPAFAVTGYQRGGHYGSDHLPVIADLALRSPDSADQPDEG
ncbi:endonuclease/exonuclease/phosphatase family protein [Pseudofrankia sp. BMG5.36]|uniref:endonuclease/exonuclease/phosphatase family protein n=1 Tax=Pseudofrankia sp. BMG5.36 TaxID=1834512 RepID=UPI000A4C8144|nr:endonuclease/exonuclease/phosphatase family protein [Pseudofrankia sp. BMG5.36]